MIKYRTFGLWTIEEVEVLRETAKTVVLISAASGKERREAKRSEYYNWHDSWEDAHNFQIAEAQRKVDLIRLQLDRANGDLGRIKGQRKPK